jgi:hypothetical protein
LSTIIFDFPFYLIFIFVAIGFAFSLLLYNNERKQKYFSTNILYILFLLRWLTFISISVFLLRPKIIKSELVEEKPILLFAQDNSKSILSNEDSVFFKSSYEDSIYRKLEELNKFYDLRTCVFGQKILKDTSFSFVDNSTNFDELYDFINNKYHGTNLTDVIVASDGIVNMGKDLPYLSISPSISVNTITLGDTMKYDDIKVKTVNNNKYALLGNDFPIEISLFCNESFDDVKIHLYSGNELIQEKKFKSLNKGLTNLTLINKADEKGIKNFKVVVSSRKADKNLLNNSKRTSIEVIDYSQKILILTSCSHPDISAMNWALEDQLKSKVTTFQIDQFTENITDFDLLVFYKPSQSKPLMKVVEKSRQLEIPSLVVLGSEIKTNASENLLFGLKQNKFKGTNEVEALLNEDFKSFGFGEKWLNLISEFPPLSVPFSIDYNLVSSANILVYQSVNNLKMPYPLIYFFNNRNVKHGVIIGEGIWRWKMAEYKLNNNANTFKDFFRKIVQYLKKIDKKSRLNSLVPKNNSQNKPLYIYAEYYNELMEIEPEADIIFSYTDSTGKEYFKNLISRDNFYDLKLTGLPIGNYSYKITVEDAIEQILSSGEFSIIPSNIEKLNTVSNPKKLAVLNQNGRTYTFSEIQILIDKLKLANKDKIKTHLEQKQKDLINYKWLLMLLILPFSEWFLRKNKGLL